MDAKDQPQVSVVTPVYNGEPYLSECIESVLGQTYQNWEYIIVNNCSKDRTLEIALEYAKKDSRIRVHRNDKFVGVMENHNIALSLISEEAKYCKVVCADDFLFPDCITKMVELGEAHPDIGIVGCYQLSGDHILWQGFEYPRSVFPGRELCRRIFLKAERTFGFGCPTSLLYRAELVRNTKAFYPNPSPHSDTSACFEQLQRSSYGFVYQVLSYERTHQATESSKSAVMDRYSSAYLSDIINYGPLYLDKQEFESVLSRKLKGYHRYLAASYFCGSGSQEFWDYHKGRLAELGYPLTFSNLLNAGIHIVLQEVLNPGQAVAKFWKRIAPKFSRSSLRREQPRPAS
jgi:glycosyltransferase involved in cell wall biosynthesis